MKSHRRNILPLSSVVKRFVVRRFAIPVFLMYGALVLFSAYMFLNELGKENIYQCGNGVGLYESYMVKSRKLMRVISIQLSLGCSDQCSGISDYLRLDNVFLSVFSLDKAFRSTAALYPVNINPERFAAPSFTHGFLEDGFYTLLAPYYSTVSRTIVMGLVYYNYPDNFIFAELNLQHLWNFVREAKSKNMVMFFTDRFGNYVAHDDFDKVKHRESVAFEKWFTKVKAASSSSSFLDVYDGKVSMISFVYGKNNMLCFVISPLANIMAPFLRFFMGLSLIFSIFLTVSWGFIRRWLIRFIVTPFEQLSREIEMAGKKLQCLIPAVSFTFQEGVRLEKTFSELIKNLYQREVELAESEMKFRNLVESAPVAILLFQGPRIVYANTEAERITGYTKDELLGLEEFWILICESHRSLIACNVMKRSAGEYNATMTYEVPILTKSGAQRVVRATVTSITLAGNPAGIIVAMDVTDFKNLEAKKRELEAQMIRDQRLESLGTLAAGVAHEFNNILQALSLNVELIGLKLTSNDTSGTLDKELLTYFDNVENLKNRASQIVRGLLDFSRDRSAGTLKSFHLNKEVEKTVSLYKALCPRHIELEMVLGASFDEIICETGQLEQILLNLLNNAKDAIEAKNSGYGVIRVETADEVATPGHQFLVPGSYVVLKVRDNGIGMKKETALRIFDPFFSTKPIGKGTGLGLSIIYGMVKNLGGHIVCDSKWMEGTEFTLWFPMKWIVQNGDEGRALQDLESCSMEKKGLKVLLLEDEQMIRLYTKGVLEEEGYTVRDVETPEEAIELLAEDDRWDLIVMDLGLPGIGGEGFLRELRQRGFDIPVVVASGYVNVGERVKQYGIKAFISKPYTVFQLKEVIRKVVAELV